LLVAVPLLHSAGPLVYNIGAFPSGEPFDSGLLPGPGDTNQGATLEGFTAHQASRFTGCTPRQLRYWDQIGLVRPSVQQTGGRPGVPRMYSFRDLVALRVVKSLLDGGMSLQRVRRAWEYLNKKAGLDEHLAEVKLVTDGKSIFKVVRREGEVLDALRQGQMAFFVAIDEVTRKVSDEVAEFRRDRDQFLRALKDATREAQLGF
jgi:DNA-binding transcriptional MerR regulator